VKRWIGSDTIFSLSNLTFDKAGRSSNLPSVASVLTIAAPNILLSASFLSFLVGLGVYLGLMWARDLDEAAGAEDSKAVFITYVVGLGVCYFAYALSNAVVSDQSYVSELDLLHKTGALLPIVDKEHGSEETSRRNGERSMPSSFSASACEYEFDSSSRQHGRGEDISTREELLRVFRQAAELRKASTELDERLARLLERLG
jgi:hypothetical protein